MEEKKTLAQLLQDMDHLDAGVLDLDLDEMDKLGKDLQSKVDAYKSVMDFMEERVEGIEARAKKMMELAKSIKNQRKSILERMAYVMSTHGLEKLTGLDFVASLRKSKAVIIDDECDPEQYAMDFPELVQSKTVFSWRKEPIKSLLDSGLTVPWAKISDSMTVNFRLKSASNKGE